MVCLGIDPDTKYVALALGSRRGILAVYSHKIKEARSDSLEPLIKALRYHIPVFMKSQKLDAVWPQRIIVEGQRINARSKVKPNDIVQLARVAGIIAGICSMLYPDKCILIPEPSEWKGSVPKYIHQARFYQKLGWGYVQHKSQNYAHPKNPTVGQKLNQGEWKHVGDACALSMWGASLNL